MANLCPGRSALLAAALLSLSLAPATRAQEEPGKPAAQAKKPPTVAELKKEEADLRAAVQAHPDDTDAHINLGRHYVITGNFPAAEAEARAAQRLGGDPDNADALLAEVLLRENKQSVLLQQIKPADREPALEAQVRLSLGEAHFDFGEMSAAEPLLRDAVRLDPASWQAHFALAEYSITTGQLPTAHEQVEAELKIDPDNVNILRQAGFLRLVEGDPAGAVAMYDKAVAVRANSFPALSERALAYLSEDKVAEAQKDAEAALALAQGSATVAYVKALLSARQGKMADANQWLSRIKGSSLSPAQYYLQGVVELSLGLYEKADADLAKFAGRVPTSTGAQRLRGEIALHRKDPQGAIDILKPVVADDPTDQAGATVLAQAYVMGGHVDEALELCRTLAAAQPGQTALPAAAPAPAQSRYGDEVPFFRLIDKIALAQQFGETVAPLAALRRGEIDQAAAAAEELVKQNPDDPAAQTLLGSVRLAQKRLPEAETIFRAALKAHPEFTPADFTLAEVLVAENQPDAAKAALQDLAKGKS